MLFGCGGGLIGMALVAVLAWRFAARLPDANAQVPANPLPILVTLLHPQPESRWPADAFLPVRAVVVSQRPIVSLELWADGQLVQTQIPAGGEQMSAEWQWMPVVDGDHQLVVKATTSIGEHVFSNVVNIHADAPVGFSLLDTSGLGADGQPNFIPQPPLEIAGSAPQPVVLPEGGFSPSTASPAPLKLWWERTFNPPAQPPAPPKLRAVSDGCTVRLLIEDQSDNESGFFVYRAEAGESVLQRVDSLGSHAGSGTLEYTEPGRGGPLLYTVSAFNAVGESASDPVQVTFNDADCLAAVGLTLEKGLLHLPPAVEQIYFYYSVNRGAFNRFPASSFTFLTSNEGMLDLSGFLDALVAVWPEIVQTVDVELWGWQGATLVELGKQHLVVDFTDLKVCNLGTNCVGDVASTFRSNYGEIDPAASDQRREFYWSTNAPHATAALWQISTQPFQGDFQPRPPGLLASGCVSGDSGGSFIVDFASLGESHSLPMGCGTDSLLPYIQLSGFHPWVSYKVETPHTLYVRITPMSGNQPAGCPSKSVVIRLETNETNIQPITLNHLPNPYRVEIVSFSPIDWADPAYWGCVYIRSLDYPTIWNSMRNSTPKMISDETITSMATELYNRLNTAMINGWAVCPAPAKDEDESVVAEWGEMLVEGLKEVWGSIVEVFNSLKNGIVEVAAGIINALGIECGQTCKARLMTGLEIGITYFTGIPPTLPNFDELKEMGIQYAIELAAAEAGIPCPEECKEALREGLEQVFEAVKADHAQPGCVSENYAQVMGKQPLCLPPGVETEPVPEGMLQPAVATIRVTNTTPAVPEMYNFNDQPAYVVRLKVKATNPNLTGKTLLYSYRYSVTQPLTESGQNDTLEGEVSDWVNDLLSSQFQSTQSGYILLQVPIAGDLIGQPFQTEDIPIPALSPGESVVIPVALRQTAFDYYIPQHALALKYELQNRGLTLDDVGGLGGDLYHGPVFDWSCLYQSAQLEVTAEVYCLSVPEGLVGQTAPTSESKLVACESKATPLVIWEATSPCAP